MSVPFEPLIEHVWVATCPRCGVESRWLGLGEGECPACNRSFVRVTEDVPVVVARRMGA